MTNAQINEQNMLLAAKEIAIGIAEGKDLTRNTNKALKMFGVNKMYTDKVQKMAGGIIREIAAGL